jgi:hypothetical protein
MSIMDYTSSEITYNIHFQVGVLARSKNSEIVQTAIDELGFIKDFLSERIRAFRSQSVPSMAVTLVNRMAIKEGRIPMNVAIYEAFMKIIDDSIDAKQVVVNIDQLVSPVEREQILNDLQTAKSQL